ncbi:hypothetical protein NA57DRAFT_79593 [Rhizodiscina lignyota]|uniref:Uncharacterized protein n=1 Tax=Rhizodiscina lignyota TaxID=1504668 RepID=A0A9P4I511_9PEZI|nr:hypothetical protein NA57DRAFT_79593 [Rhizodiscina lignyota]
MRFPPLPYGAPQFQPSYGPSSFPSEYGPPSEDINLTSISNQPIFWLLVCWQDSFGGDDKDVTDMFHMVTEEFNHDAGYCGSLYHTTTFQPQTLFLFVLYYVGHGRLRHGRLVLESQDPDVRPSIVDFDALATPLLQEASCDTLFIMDCCYSGFAPRDLLRAFDAFHPRNFGRRVQMLAACGTTQETAGEGLTFTQALVRVLARILRGQSRGNIGSILVQISDIIPPPEPRPLIMDLLESNPNPASEIQILPL